jgi:hypothetical protein
VGTLLKGEATAERPEAGIVWADTGDCGAMGPLDLDERAGDCH